MDLFVAKIPVWAVPYLMNDDPSGLKDNEKDIADKWWTENKAFGMAPVSEDEGECLPYFDPFPAFGLGSEVIDCNVMRIA